MKLYRIDKIKTEFSFLYILGDHQITALYILRMQYQDMPNLAKHAILKSANFKSL